MSAHELGPLPVAAMRRRQQRRNGSYCMVPAYSEDEMRAYALAEVARAVEAERERCAKLCDEKYLHHAAGGFPRAASTARSLAAAIREGAR